MEKGHKTKKHFVYLGFILALGLILASFVLGTQFKNLRPKGVISVKGVAEGMYQSAEATWEIRTKVWNLHAKESLEKVKRKQEVLRKFLLEHFTENQLKDYSFSVNQNYEYEYDPKTDREKSIAKGYNATGGFIITTRDLQVLEKVRAKVVEWGIDDDEIVVYSPEFYLEDLEKIKIEMISQATKDARNRAEEFAKTGGAKVGAMKSASQGTFNIYAENDKESEEGFYGGSYSKSTIGKKVRLVVTIQYEIE